LQLKILIADTRSRQRSRSESTGPR